MAKGEIERLLQLCPIKPAERRGTLLELFRAAGCPEGMITAQAVTGSVDPNLIVTLPGSGDESIYVGAHFDASRFSWGIIDNWSGAVMLSALYRSLAVHPRRHTFVFIAFAAEEQGLKGSKAFARGMSPDAVHKARAMINLDCLAMSTTAVWVKRSNRSLWEAISRVASGMGLPLRGINMKGVSGSDADPFARLKIPTLVVHSSTQEAISILHNFRDDFPAVRGADYYDSYKLMAMLLAYLDIKLETVKRPG